MMSLFSPCIFGNLTLKNRMVMAPMTRCRALTGNVPGPLTVMYYVQRASAGLIITEGSQVSPQGVGFNRTPGIYSMDQVTAWKEVTTAVHKEGGNIFLQLFSLVLPLHQKEKTMWILINILAIRFISIPSRKA